MFSFDEQLGRRIHRRRRALGLTQAQLGAAVGSSFQQIQKYECGANRMSAAKAWEIAKALDMPIEALFDAPLETTVSTALRRRRDRRERDAQIETATA